ncbi:hypothetical protein PflSS101_1676 [Pseudomonas lactis]|uniref:Uncharacterized protein n=1 Tax=Pseudomonas lactis TaxID=1615674 RepID=I4KE88_9PSED|nr:hypothetical protein PflSS101_1676 [Pseudomonas lactis]
MLLLALPPATIKFDVYGTPAYTDKLAALKIELEKIGMPYIGYPCSFMYRRGLFLILTTIRIRRVREPIRKSLLTGSSPISYIKFRSEALPVQAAPETPVEKALKDFNGWMLLSSQLTLEGPPPSAICPLCLGCSPKKLQPESLKTGLPVSKSSLCSINRSNLLRSWSMISRYFQKSD